MHRDLAFWALLCDLIYYSLDLEAPLNTLFIVTTHPISFIVSFVSLTVGGFAIVADGDLVKDRAERDENSLTTSWVLHICIYWMPTLLTFSETLLSRSYLQRRYGLFLIWPLDDWSIAIKIAWSFLATPILVAAWFVTGNDPSSQYQTVGVRSTLFWSLLCVSNLIGSMLLIYIVRYRSEYEDMMIPTYSSPKMKRSSRWALCLPIN
eukprot:TRINITY_DN11555_c0_g1_i1.p1 TRINITY_DN11555_c0_g1~~TRINITY_DN11555_c0_g1_i1.p1  ORF type:complete len:207 (+),score=43.68 TRINITY_DN11555_c0_g1_i1:91-711(+)